MLITLNPLVVDPWVEKLPDKFLIEHCTVGAVGSKFTNGSATANCQSQTDKAIGIITGALAAIPQAACAQPTTVVLELAPEAAPKIDLIPVPELCLVLVFTRT